MKKLILLLLFFINCGDNATEPNAIIATDCAGISEGTALLDECGICVGGNTGLTACEKDCSGTYGGNALEDNCGVCDNDLTNDCIADCNGDYGGTADCLLGNWHLDKMESWNSQFCTGDPMASNSDFNRYRIFKENNITCEQETDDCVCDEQSYTRNESSSSDYININNIYYNIIELEKSTLTLKINQSSYCFKYYYTKKETIEECD